MYDVYRQSSSVPTQLKWFSARDEATVAGSIPLALIIFITISYFLQFSFYCNMRLIQFNVYFNHHIHIFLLSYVTKYSHFRKCE